ncbi:orotidine 5'-phosphate decarboxylase [Fervidicella metallireducens AeB]|uniref:Orotidine 5'-phosphate decarboxylase n=1 Tax=Fervidicella metallireducens AeB TaxID=1403537 RepID=A0A017RVP6_9CLOT|nr:orotidine-5'-phosphate decarboxylase [Fervidicella metallireducens]EYE87970.1 orotidine 5'-phosphate decarboxylase [Fervidicella metallireducens AeB]
MIIDKLFNSVKEKGHVCVGLDTSLDYIPDWFKKRYVSLEDLIFEFNKVIIDTTLDISACYKVQIAYYEAHGINGVKAYKKTLEYLRSKNSIIIADIKRGDIADTAKMYARAHFEGDFESDFITINPYMGLDSIEPYLPYIENKNKGIFTLVRTSNKGAEDIQYIIDKNGKRVFSIVAEKINGISEKYIGKSGYSSIGAVVGCTHIDEGRELRERCEKMFFLIPGYGAQGGTAKDVAILLKNGNGGIVNSSRGILLAYKKYENGESDFGKYARQEVLKMKEDILNAVQI